MVKVILKKMVLKIIKSFRQHIDILKRVSNTNDHFLSWKSKGLSDESIKSPSTSNNMLNPLLDYVGTKTRVEFKGRC